jgi:hypothetical protein
MSVRKVLGAGNMDLVVLVSKEFVYLVLFAAAVAIPLSYQGIAYWLTGYAFRIDLQWWLFAIPVLLVTLLAMTTVGLQALKDGLRNPVENLRREWKGGRMGGREWKRFSFHPGPSRAARQHRTPRALPCPVGSFLRVFFLVRLLVVRSA